MNFSTSCTNGNGNKYSTMYLLCVLKSVGDILSASHHKSWKFTFVSTKYCEFWR